MFRRAAVAAVMASGALAWGGPVAGAVDGGLGRLLAAQGRAADAVARIAVAPAAARRAAAGVARAVALAPEWERPALLAAEVGGRWLVRPLGRGVEVATLELRDVTGDGAPEVVARLTTRERRTEHEMVVTRVAVYRVDAGGFGAQPVFDAIERVDERALPGHVGAISGGALFGVEFVRAAGSKPSEIVVTLVSDRIDDEHQAFQIGGVTRRPVDLAGRFVWDGKRFARRSSGPTAPRT